MEPIVSIVVCTYNGEKYIEEQLSSLINQTYKSLEIIIVDDGSTDDTLSLVKKIQLSDQRITCIQNTTNLGYNRNFEKAILLASSEYIAISDQDDVWAHDKIEKLMRLWGDPDTLIVTSTSALFRSGEPPRLNHLRLKKPFEGNDARKLLLFNHIAGHDMMIRKKLLQWALPFPPSIYYDWWLAVVACANGNIKSSNDILVFHRIHSKNASTVRDKHAFHKKVNDNVPVLLAAPNLCNAHLKFGQELIDRFKQLQNHSFSWRLFFYLLRHSRIIFFYKKRMFPYFSYIKQAFALASSKTTTK